MGQLTLPVLPADLFSQRLSLETPTLAACLGDRTVACETYVSPQCKGLVASAVLVSPTSLAPLPDVGLQVEVRSEKDGTPGQTAPVQLAGSQLNGTRALISVVLRKPRRNGASAGRG